MGKIVELRVRLDLGSSATDEPQVLSTTVSEASDETAATFRVQPSAESRVPWREIIADYEKHVELLEAEVIQLREKLAKTSGVTPLPVDGPGEAVPVAEPEASPLQAASDERTDPDGHTPPPPTRSAPASPPSKVELAGVELEAEPSDDELATLQTSANQVAEKVRNLLGMSKPPTDGQELSVFDQPSATDTELMLMRPWYKKVIPPGGSRSR